MLRGGPVARYQRFSDVSSTGVFGAPRAASREKGERISEAVVERLVELVRSLRASG
jgi:creatinine amidohydrolase